MKKFSILSFLILLALSAVYTLQPKPAMATFNANNLIDDYIFDNTSTLTASQIDTWLNSNFPSSCISTNNGFTAPDPTGYSPNPSQFFYSSSPVSAGQVIYDTAQAYSINPQVLITTLQKEETLVDGSAGCSSWRFASAAGYGCTDSGSNTHDYSYPSGGLVTPLYYTHGNAVNSISGSCVNSGPKAGFTEQIIHAAWLLSFGRHKSEGNTSWAVVKTNWNNCDDNNTCPSAWGISAADACYGGPMTQGTFMRCPTDSSAVPYDGYATIDGTAVHMDTGATAALYWYTPHLSGNQHFDSIFQNWFGSTVYLTSKTIIGNVPVSIITHPATNPAVGQKINYVVSFKNNFPFDITFAAVGAIGRAGNISLGANRDFGWQGPVTLASGASQQFTFSTTDQDVGNTYIWPSIFYQGSYVQYNSWGDTIVGHTPNLTLSQALATSISSTIYAGQDITFTAKLKNNEPNPISYDAIGIPVKFYDRYNYDAVWVGPGEIAAGAEVNLSGTRNIDKPGPFSYWVSDYFGGNYSTIGSVNKFTSVQATPSFAVSGLSFSKTSPVKGEKLTASFAITNTLPVSMDVDAVGIVGRYGSLTGENRDIGWQGPIHFNPGETKSFSGLSRVITDVGKHYYWVGVLWNGTYLQYNAWGSTIVSLAPNFSVSGLNFSSTSPTTGQTLSATFSITSNLPVPVDVDAVGIVGRLGTFTGPNRDLGWQGPVHFNAGETKSFTQAGTITEAGTHYYWIGIMNGGQYLQYNNWGSTIISQ